MVVELIVDRPKKWLYIFLSRVANTFWFCAHYHILTKLCFKYLQKERKLIKHKWISGNWIARKFQKHNGDHEQFLAQVGLRLISKVINMKKLRKDHLIWCSEKLKQIKFVDRKIKMEYSILLFPC